MKLQRTDFKSLIPENYIPRSIHNELYNHITSRKEVTILYGPRQVGKSSEIINIARIIHNNTPQTDLFYYNLDQPSKDFNDVENFISIITTQCEFPENICYIFIDEAQRLSNIGLFTKYIYDKKLNFKFILTGSASLDIKEKIKEPLTGRKKEFYLNSLSLPEILQYNGIEQHRITGYFSELGDILDKYLIWGGYPEVVLEPSVERKQEKLEEIADSYILRDMMSLFELGNVDMIRAVSIYLAECIGNLYSEHGTSMLLSYSRTEVARIIHALEKSFVLQLIPSFSKHKSKELLHAKKIYFHDCGIRNALISRLDEYVLLSDRGKLFENAIAAHFFTKYGRNKVKFWRTQNKTEVDFVIQNSISNIEAYETKYVHDKDSIPRSLGSFIGNYNQFIAKSGVISRKNYWKYI
ncbi:MAG: ATP-binding protein [Candidatus Dojkabacteria bacterium]